MEFLVEMHLASIIANNWNRNFESHSRGFGETSENPKGIGGRLEGTFFCEGNRSF
jgi:hypothetical protein